jgi:hypothetical protein
VAVDKERQLRIFQGTPVVLVVRLAGLSLDWPSLNLSTDHEEIAMDGDNHKIWNGGPAA